MITDTFRQGNTVYMLSSNWHHLFHDTVTPSHWTTGIHRVDTPSHRHMTLK